MSRHDDDLTPAERRAFDALPMDVPAPDALESRVVGALRRKRLLVDRTVWWRAPAPGVVALAAAACVATLAIGVGIGRTSVEPELPRAAFILFLHAGPEFEPFSEDNFSSRFSDYNEWVAETRRSGHFITGEQLDESGAVVIPSSGGPVVEARPPADAEGAMLGMFMINATDYEDATRIALSLPHIEYGGRVVVRRVDPI